MTMALKVRGNVKCIGSVDVRCRYPAKDGQEGCGVVSNYGPRAGRRKVQGLRGRVLNGRRAEVTAQCGF